MEVTLLNGTWSNDTQTTVQNVNNSNSTREEMLSIKNPLPGSIDWASQKKALYTTEVILHCTFLIVGLFGNSLTIAMLLYKKWTNITSRHILMALALSDTFMIITHTFNQDFMKDLFKLDVRAFSNFGCKAFFVFYRTSKMTSSWFVVFLCFERFLAVMLPLRVKQIITEKLTKIYIGIIYVIMAGFSTILSFSTGIKNKGCKKNAFASSQKSTYQALALCEMFLYSVLPIILMSIFTPIIILKLFKQHQTRKNALSSERENQQFKELIRTTIVLISVVVAFVICVTPITVFQQLKFWQQLTNKEIERVFSIFLFMEICQRIEQVNYSINFFLYIFTSPTFRTSVLEMLHIPRKTESQKHYGSSGLQNTRNGQGTLNTQNTMEESTNTIPPACMETADHSVQIYTEKQPNALMQATAVPTHTDIQTSLHVSSSTDKPPKTTLSNGERAPTSSEDPSCINRSHKTVSEDGIMEPTSKGTQHKTAQLDDMVATSTVKLNGTNTASGDDNIAGHTDKQERATVLYNIITTEGSDGTNTTEEDVIVSVYTDKSTQPQDQVEKTDRLVPRCSNVQTTDDQTVAIISL